MILITFYLVLMLQKLEFCKFFALEKFRMLQQTFIAVLTALMAQKAESRPFKTNVLLHWNKFTWTQGTWHEKSFCITSCIRHVIINIILKSNSCDHCFIVLVSLNFFILTQLCSDKILHCCIVLLVNAFCFDSKYSLAQWNQNHSEIE